MTYGDVWSIMAKATTVREAVQSYLDIVESVRTDESEAAALVAKRLTQRAIYYLVSVQPNRILLEMLRSVQ